MHTLKFDTGQVDFGQIAGIEASAAYFDNLVPVFEIGFGQLQHRLGLESLHKGGTQAEDQIAFEISMLGLRNLRTFFGALQAQLPLVFAFVQVIDAGLFERALEGSPDSVVRCDLRAVSQ